MASYVSICFAASLSALIQQVYGFERPAECLLPKVTGKCRALIYKFFFNVTSNQCEQFVYGGCNGNENSFVTFGDCVEHCQGVKDKKEQQVLKKAAGPFYSLFGDDEENDVLQRSTSGEEPSEAVANAIWDLTYMNWFIFVVMVVCLVVFIKFYVSYRKKVEVKQAYRAMSNISSDQYLVKK